VFGFGNFSSLSPLDNDVFALEKSHRNFEDNVIGDDHSEGKGKR